jgi:ankyrin repeat protein
VVNILVAGGVDLERVNSLKWSPLRLAVLKRRVEVVRVLVAAGADVQATAPLLPPDGPQFPPPFPSPDVFACPDDMTALTLAALDNQLPIARILLAHTDASMSIRSNRVALAAAADRGYVQTRDRIPGSREVMYKPRT